MNYFQQHNIKSITLQNNNLVIEYNNSTSETKDINTAELQAIQAYCQQQSLNKLSLSDLQRQQQTQPNKFNWKSPWVIGTGLVLALGIIVYFSRQKKQK